MRAGLIAFLAAGCATPVTGRRESMETIPGTAITFELVFIPAERPFWLGKFEVSWDEYEAYYLTEETGADTVTRPTAPYEPPDHGMGRGRRPATSMHPQAAEKYCEWLSLKTGKKYRLPTEAEWEFAAKGSCDPIDDFAWHAGNSGGKFQGVGLKKPNAYGLHDMLGNVWEYCAGPTPVLRGGSWKQPAAEINAHARTGILDAWTERDPERPKSVWWLTDAPFVGFRVARDAD